MLPRDFWTALEPRARIGAALGAALILISLAAVAAWLLRTDWQVLFADLKPQDTAAMVVELDRLKVPYRIGDDGNTILVEGSIVHSTRLKLMGKDMPLHGAAGFELFNNADFGMTEFAQKINYQRALQGEITRTILSLSEVRDARVHLALPEEGLFKRSNSKPKAAITLTLKPGESLRAEQVTGVQRLVAAAVPGIAAQDVTIVDQQGVALTRPAPADSELDMGAGRLDLKRDTEKLLARKATEVLEQAFGPGQVLASVDVTLNMDQVHVTTEDVTGAPSQGGSTGVVVRERESSHDTDPPLGRGDAASRGGNSQHEIEYQVGRRVEQVATQPGSIRLLHVVAVVRKTLDDKQTDQVRELVSAAVGAVPERGDTVVVQSLQTFQPTPIHDEPAGGDQSLTEARPVIQARSMQMDWRWDWRWGAVGAVVAALAAAALLATRMLPRHSPRLSIEQRDALLKQLHHWMSGERDAA